MTQRDITQFKKDLESNMSNQEIGKKYGISQKDLGSLRSLTGEELDKRITKAGILGGLRMMSRAG
jgi:hypothetical protein